jgi:hypothetical protein
MKKTKAQQLRFVAKIEIFIGSAMVIAAAMIYIMREKWLSEDDMFIPIIIGVFGITSLLNVKLLQYLAAKHEEKNPSPVEY